MAKQMRAFDWLGRTRRVLSNRWRLVRWKGLETVVLRVQGSYPERTPRRSRPFPLSLFPWPPPPPSVESFRETLERLAADPRVKGTVLVISGLSAGSATLASLRQGIKRFRESGKHAVAYLLDQGMWAYYLAAACDEVLAPESAGLQAAGLWAETVFLKDTLALLGVEADLESIGAYKASPDTFRRSDMSAPHREMLESLLDSIYDHVVGAIAADRTMPTAQVRALLDRVPLHAEEMLRTGLLDGVCYEDELPARLAGDGQPAALVAWSQAERKLVRPLHRPSGRAVGIISLEGMIVVGPSRQPPLPLPLPLPVPEHQAGSETVVSQLRTAAQNDRLAAVVLHVDSPGGSALASDLIWREVVRLGQEKPVVVYMSNRAASGGYYVAAPAHAIVAQPTTLTGSIGIWGGKVVTQGMYQKVRANREVVQRGQAAGLYADDDAFTPEERARIQQSLADGYARFKARVVEGRKINPAVVEDVAGGRVWTGVQAVAHGLVDELGDLHHAAARARALAGVPEDGYLPLEEVPPSKKYQPPLPPGDSTAEWLAGIAGLLREGVWAMAPWRIRIRDR
ncbi:MAG: S49 family peptidase [Anaerolineae bacterium]|nr:S49 family peptidase [Anaerolineae bacterium]